MLGVASMFNQTARTVMALAVASLAWLATSAMASPVAWTLQNVEFRGGTSAFGSFTYDADSDVFSDLDVTIQDGASLIQMSVFRFGSASVLNLFGPTGATAAEFFLQLVFDPELSNAGGTVDLVAGTAVALCAENTGPLDCRLENVATVVDGATATAHIPEPASMALVGIGLVGLALGRRRQAR